MEPFDLVLDCIGLVPLYQGSHKFLKPKREYITVGVDTQGMSTVQTMQAFLRFCILAYLPEFMGGAARKVQTYSLTFDENALEDLVGMLAAGEIHVPIDGEYGFEKEDVMKAYERQMSARVSQGTWPGIMQY
jgi:NADPH:quinone reductase-like Zn-dependent oxidoreductase